MSPSESMPPESPAPRREGAPADWLVESALEETLGGNAPPDLSARIEAALAMPQAPELSEAAPRADVSWIARRRSRRVGVVVGLAAALVLWLGVEWTQRGRTTPGAFPVVVRAGVAALRRGGVETQFRSGATLAVAAADHLLSLQQDTTLLMGDLGVLKMSPSAEIDVMTMNWKDFGSGAVLGSITVGVVAGGIHWFSGDSNVKAGAGDTMVLSRTTDAKGMREELEAAKKHIQELEARPAATSLPSRSAVESVEVAAKANAPAASAPASLAYKLRFSTPALEKALAGVDWKIMGETTPKLMALISKLAEAAMKGEKPDIALLAEIQAQNGKLVIETIKLMQGGVPGTGANGTFTHPMVVANHLAAMLDSAKLSLSDAQSDQMRELASRFTQEDELRRAGYGSDVSQLQNFMDEMAMKARFYKEALGELSPEQRAILESSDTRGRAGFDVMSTGVAWAPVTKPMTGATREDVATNISSDMGMKLSLDSAQKDQFNAIVQKWTAKLPDSYWNAPSSPLDQYRAYPTDRIEEAAQFQLGMYKDLLNSGVLTPEQKSALIQMGAVYLPMKSGK